MNNNFDNGVDRKGTACIKWDFQMRNYGLDNLIPFSIADADYSIHKPILEAIKKRVDNGVLGYTDMDNQYYEAVKSWVSTRHFWDIQSDWIVPTGAIVPAIYNAIEALLEKDAKIIVQTPVYDPFFTIIKAAGREIVENELILDETGYHMDFENLEELCKNGAKMLIMCSPHNPVCRVWTKEELDKLASIAKKYDIYVVSDEIHWDLILGDVKHTTMGVYNEIHDKLIVCISCSKTFNMAGLETSNLLIPGEKTRESYKRYLYSRYLFGPNTLGLESVKAAYTHGAQWVDEQCKYLKENVDIVVEFFNENLPDVKIATVEGTYLLWLDMRCYKLTSKEIVAKIASHGAGLNSGSSYGKNYEGFVRMNVACPKEQLLKGLECIKKALA